MYCLVIVRFNHRMLVTLNCLHIVVEVLDEMENEEHYNTGGTKSPIKLQNLTREIVRNYNYSKEI